MKPIKLTMQAFGPYAIKQEVDFTKLAGKTMFVISGTTGAGKTTIFDGISFAIYGRASGDDRSGTDLRSQFAGDDTVTEVSLSFELRGKRYFIVRSPQQEKKKTRGEGTTTIGAKAELYEVTTEQKLLAANVREVDEKINEMMKLDCHQFRQIMMIPQGEFRKLLVSESKDKEKILQKLFHTELYKSIEEKLKEKASSLRKQVENQVLERNSFVSQIQSEENETLAKLKETEHLNINELLEQLESSIQRENQQLASLANEIVTKEEFRQLLQKEIHSGNEIIHQKKTLENLLLQKQSLEEKVPSIEKMTETIQFAQKAANLNQQEKQCLDLEKQIITKEQELKNATTLVSNLCKSLKDKLGTLDELNGKSGERESVYKELNRLQALEKDMLSYSNLSTEVTIEKKQLEKIKSKKELVEKNYHELEKKIQGFLENKDLAQQALVKQSELSLQLTKDEKLLSIITDLLLQKKKLIELENQFSTAEDDREDVEDELKEKNEELESLLQKWYLGQAGLLAKKLTIDDPCPVCGSTEHPNKASIDLSMPEEDELKSLQQEVKLLEQKKQQLDLQYFEVKSKFETHMDRVINLADTVSMELPYQMRSTPLDDLEEILTEHCKNLKVEMKNQEHIARSASGLDIEIKAAYEKRDELQESLKKYQDEHEKTFTAFVQKKSLLERILETLPEEIREEASYRLMTIELEKKLKDYDRNLQQAQQEVNNTKEKIASVEGTITSLQKVLSEMKLQLQELQVNFNEKLVKLGFSSKQQYGEFNISEIEIRKMEANVQAFREELRSVTDRYLELAGKLDHTELPDMDLLANKLEGITAEINLLQQQRNQIYYKVQTNQSIFDHVKRITKEIAKVEEEFKVLGDLADISSGKNTYKITFERFVLAAFLDEILLAANARLGKMASGRYKLQRKTDRSKGNAQSGLELLVFDQYTGMTRHVKTLSGGESFKASLSLALGLADIVQSFSGGVSMETMFIDEGFGTLDPESLEHAIETLIDIQSTGRLVGIISHVPELKERIDARFEVTSTQSGSIVSYHDETIHF